MEYPFTDQQRREALGGKMLADRILSRELTGIELPFSGECREMRSARSDYVYRSHRHQ